MTRMARRCRLWDVNGPRYDPVALGRTTRGVGASGAIGKMFVLTSPELQGHALRATPTHARANR
jgi:hypothetical protein